MYKELRLVLLVLHITSQPGTKGYLIRQTYIQLQGVPRNMTIDEQF